MDALAPGFLIAVPQMQDPNFKQSVVFLLERNDAGALGVVINRESPMLLAELCSDHQIPYAGEYDKRVRHGGRSGPGPCSRSAEVGVPGRRPPSRGSSRSPPRCRNG